MHPTDRSRNNPALFAFQHSSGMASPHQRDKTSGGVSLPDPLLVTELPLSCFSCQNQLLGTSAPPTWMCSSQSQQLTRAWNCVAFFNLDVCVLCNVTLVTVFTMFHCISMYIVPPWFLLHGSSGLNAARQRVSLVTRVSKPPPTP